MSSDEMRSLKYSVRSKSRIATESFVFQQENQSSLLPSSWISHFLPTSTATICSNFSNDKSQNSNFSIIRRPINPPPQPLKLASFGPFQVRETGRRGEREEGGNVRVFERGMKDEGVGEGVIPGFDTVYSSRRESCFGPWVISGGFGVDAARRRGDAYHDLSQDGFVSRAFQDIHNQHGNVIIPHQPAIQVRKKEAEEPFSFWNMGRFKRANFVSSVSPSFDLSSNYDRKRKPIAEDMNFSKIRRM